MKSLEIKKYLEVKNHAYKTIRYLNSIYKYNKPISTKDIFEMLIYTSGYDFNSEEFLIYIQTLLIPNDYDFAIYTLNNMKTNQLKQVYNLPTCVIASKQYEAGLYNLKQLIDTGALPYICNMKGLLDRKEIDMGIYGLKEDKMDLRESIKILYKK